MKTITKSNAYKSKLKYVLAAFLSLTVLLLFQDALAAQDAGAIASNVLDSFSNIAKLITASAYIAGLGFAIGAILKFKQHKDNPTQIPVGTPIAMLFIATALIFLPTIFGVAGQTIFGDEKSAGGPQGIDTIDGVIN